MKKHSAEGGIVLLPSAHYILKKDTIAGERDTVQKGFRMKSKIVPRKSLFWLYLTPGVLLYIFVVFLPVMGALYYGMFQWSGGPKKTFIGLENYIRIFSDAVFWKSFVNNLLLVCICIAGQIGFAFFLAVLLNSKRAKMAQLHRVVSYFPATLSAVVIAFIWSMIYDYNYGILNYFLRAFGFEDAAQPWLSNPKLAIFLVSIPLIWQYIGYYLIIILSAFSSIDSSILEMAEIDGANTVQRARYITFPMIKSTLVVCVTLCIAGNMKAFDHIYVMTGGGPGTSSMVMSLYAYNNSFLKNKMGYGSALSIGILVLSLLITLGTRTLIAKKGKD